MLELTEELPTHKQLADPVMGKTSVEVTDGKRLISISGGDKPDDQVELKFCSNGYQSTVVCVDHEMLFWLKGAIEKFNF